jgi:hypothetical protein
MHACLFFPCSFLEELYKKEINYRLTRYFSSLEFQIFNPFKLIVIKILNFYYFTFYGQMGGFSARAATSAFYAKYHNHNNNEVNLHLSFKWYV